MRSVELSRCSCAIHPSVLAVEASALVLSALLVIVVV